MIYSQLKKPKCQYSLQLYTLQSRLVSARASLLQEPRYQHVSALKGVQIVHAHLFNSRAGQADKTPSMGCSGFLVDRSTY